MTDATLAPVPARSTSRYDGRYADCQNVPRLLEMLQESLRLAAESKVPETARARFDLVVELYHQLGGLELPAPVAREVATRVTSLARRFETLWRVNAANGLCERGRRSGLLVTRQRYFDEALTVLDEGLAASAGDVEALRAARLIAVAQSAAAPLEQTLGTDKAAPAHGAPAEPDLVELYSQATAKAPATVSPSEPGASIALEVLPRLHVALLDNGVPLVLDCQVANLGPDDIVAARLVFESTGELVERLEIELCDLEARVGRVEIGRGSHRCPLVIQRGTFERLTERTSGEIVARLFDGDGHERAAARVAVEAFPRDYWMGLSVVPEMLAAFVLPNDTAVAAVAQRAAHYLHAATGSPSLDGYQSKDPERVLPAVGAVYSALQEIGATYIVAPASFESSGQRVRLPAQIAAGKQANCLDITLCAAGVLEAIGLHPLLVVVEGHAFCGVWLEEESFPNPTVDEVLRLTKRIELRELAVFDAVAVLARPSPSFDEARGLAERHLDKRDTFLAAIDVHRARLGRLLPLAEQQARTGFHAEGIAAGISQTASTRDIELAMQERLAAERQRGTSLAPAGRVDRWLRQLLDLSMRNRLLNCEGSRRSIPLLGAQVGVLEDLISDGKNFRVLPRPSELELDRLGPEARRDRSVLREKLAPILSEGVARGELRADLAGDELDARMLAIYRDAMTAREEGGASSLFLAVGFLDYFEDARSTRRRRAPLLLVPLELRRGSLHEGYKLTRGDDETRLNVTLVEYLAREHQVEVRGLETLPEDESGVDVPLVLRLVREAIKREGRWEVVEESAIGLFSFSKFLVWRDLRDRGEELKRNALVRHLIETPRAVFEDGVEMPELAALDGALADGEMLCPLSADSSQLRAVLAAARGKTLVLEGPPGTGKSQTITNLIAHSLASGRSVLLVSEKMAALEVVHRRLRQVGLGEACLELHSNKANKKLVLEQFRAALDFAADDSVDGWQRLVGNLADTRRRLNEHVLSLHRRRTSGESVHDVLARISELEGAPEVPFTLGDPSSIDAEQLSVWRAALSEFGRQALERGVGPDHALLDVGHATYSPKWERDARAALETCVECADLLLAAAKPFVHEYLGGAEPLTDASWDSACAVLATAVAPPTLGPGAARSFERPDTIERVRAAVALARQLAEREGRLDADFRASPTALDLVALEQLRRERAATWFLPAWLRGRKLVAAFRGLARNPNAIDVERAIAALDEARRVIAERAELAAASDAARALLGATWSGAATDASVALAALDWLAQVGACVRLAAQAEQRMGDALVATIERLLAQSPEQLAATGPIAAAVERLAAARRAYDESRRAVARAVEPSAVLVEPAGLQSVERLRSACLRWLDAWSEVRAWCRYRAARATAVSSGLTDLVLRVESGATAPASVEHAFERAFARAWTMEEVSADPALADFDGGEHQKVVERFVDLDTRHIDGVRGLLRQRLSERSTVRKNQSRAAKESELGVLVHELTKKTRHKAIRKLLQEVGGVAQQLKPCFLMSPMSVAQYLDTSFPPFDLVVFDEASQIPVWDAIGALARGRQAVVVGDPKQLPPTSFFSRGEDENAGEDETQDLESILDECMGAQVPALRLAWHYRSRHESLIAFSNERYYGNHLLTFPANSNVDLGVSWRFVEGGTYDKGGTRSNLIEARAVVDEVVRRLLDPVLSRSSIGVVTFSQPQQTLVLDLLEAARREHPTIEAFFAEDNDDAVFVKNLENVQGDERDVILFSIGYGPDVRGRVSMNFGPLNKAGGQRRLNVAVTRARREIVVFTSLRAHQIDLSRSQAEGVRDLRAFLEYAERAGSSDSPVAPTTRRASSRIVAALVAALQERGHVVDVEVGCSGYRIDLAVRDPDAPGEHLLGVETDGPNYRSAATARDRDALRHEVLKGLGWRLHRVWAVDFWRAAARELERLDAALREARDQRQRARTRTPHVAALESAVASSKLAKPQRELDGADVVRDGTADAVEAPTSNEIARPGERRLAPYRAVEHVRYELDQELFYEQRSTETITRVVRAVIERESPIVRDQLVKRVTELWGFQRARAKCRAVVEAQIDALRPVTSHFEDQVVYWRNAEHEASFGGYRPSARAVEELPAPELGAVLLEALERSGAMSTDALYRAGLSALDATSVTSKRRAACERALRALLARHLVVLEGDRVRLAPSV